MLQDPIRRSHPPIHRRRIMSVQHQAAVHHQGRKAVVAFVPQQVGDDRIADKAHRVIEEIQAIQPGTGCRKVLATEAAGSSSGASSNRSGRPASSCRVQTVQTVCLLIGITVMPFYTRRNQSVLSFESTGRRVSRIHTPQCFFILSDFFQNRLQQMCGAGALLPKPGCTACGDPGCTACGAGCSTGSISCRRFAKPV